MRVALFDLDETLLDGVSDLLWSEYLAERGEGDAEVVRGFHRDYQLGQLDLGKFLATYLDPFVRLEAELLHAWREDWHATRAAPRVKPLGRALVEQRRAEGFHVALVTATNDFLAGRIAQGLGIDELIATRLERDGERYTGRIVGEPCFREGKIARVASWLEARGSGFDEPGETWFYSDSHNDLPLLSRVSHPVCVDPDPRLAAIAAARGWPVLSLRAPESAAT
jgi:HAD superfamily hydrolase (TIGR01490 family)